jgi:hypothetical protein
MDYVDFIETKRKLTAPSGFDVDKDTLNPWLFPVQRDIVKWALYVGKAAIFADCGLGKELMHLEWANQVNKQTGGPILILAPLAVAYQTIIEADKFGIDLHHSKGGKDIRGGLNITNYEKLHQYDSSMFPGIALDESSILKGLMGKMHDALIEFARLIPYRLATSATPAPNDLMELVRQAEYLGIMNEMEIRALFFTQDGNSSNKFRLKKHAEPDFWKWVASWAVVFRKPSDLGYDDSDFILPAIHKHRVSVHVEPFDTGMLFAVEATTLDQQRTVRKASLHDRAMEAAKLANDSDEPWLIWCDLNDESEALRRAIPDAIEVKGSDSPEHKEDAMIGFSQGKYRVLVSKPSICGFGMNWQHCRNVIFVGLSHSYEKYYQAVRRVWRFGQTREVHVYVITTDADGPVIESIERKERQAMNMYDRIVHYMSQETNFERVARQDMKYEEDVKSGKKWALYLGDSIKTIDHISDNSVGLSIFSPPFPGMYVFTNSPHDISNVSDIDQMMAHFKYLIGKDKLYRVMMPGRNVFIHITQGVALKGRDGYIGLKDYRGKIIDMMEDGGWIHYGEITIDKDPQLKAMRTKDHGLMFKSLVGDSARMHSAMADMLLQFRKPGDNPVPIRAGNSPRYHNPDGWVTDTEWINWARPVWYAADYQPGTWKPNHTGDSCPDGIRETDVLSVRQARDSNDERHLTPLQIGVIDRVVKLWSAPDEIVYSPFAGIGSEGYSAVRLGRRFIGGELKKSYWLSAIKNLQEAESANTMTLFDFSEAANGI